MFFMPSIRIEENIGDEEKYMTILALEIIIILLKRKFFQKENKKLDSNAR